MRGTREFCETDLEICTWKLRLWKRNLIRSFMDIYPLECRPLGVLEPQFEDGCHRKMEAGLGTQLSAAAVSVSMETCQGVKMRENRSLVPLKLRWGGTVSITVTAPGLLSKSCLSLRWKDCIKFFHRNLLFLCGIIKPFPGGKGHSQGFLDLGRMDKARLSFFLPVDCAPIPPSSPLQTSSLSI